MERLFILVSVVIALGLSSCQDPPPSGEDGNEILFWEYFDPSMDEGLDEILQQFTQSSGYFVSRDHMEPTALKDSYIQAVLAGEGPDLILAPSDHIGSISVSGAGLQALEIIPEEFFDRISPQAREYTKIHDTVWGVPLLLGNSIILFYNTDLVPTPPATWEELVILGQKLTTKDRWGLTYNFASPFFFAPFFTAFGGTFFAPGTNEPTLDTPAMNQALTVVRDLKFTQKILAPGTGSESANNLFARGKAAFLINGPWAIGHFTGKVPFALAPLPLLKGHPMRPLISCGTLIYHPRLKENKKIAQAVRDLTAFLLKPEIQVELAGLSREWPVVLEAQESPELRGDPWAEAFHRQILQGVPMPSIPEMRAVFDAMRPPLEEVMPGGSGVEDSARAMQNAALKDISSLSRNND